MPLTLRRTGLRTGDSVFGKSMATIHFEGRERLSRRGCSKMPTLRFRNQEIAKYLDASDRLQFLGINEISV